MFQLRAENFQCGHAESRFYLFSSFTETEDLHQVNPTLGGNVEAIRCIRKQMKVDSGSRQNWIIMPALLSTKLHNLRSNIEVV